MSLTEYIREQARVADANSKEWLLKGGGAVQSSYRNGMWYAYHDVEERVAALENQLTQATAILRRNLASLRSDVNLKGQINQQRHDDYLEACRICGVEP